MSGASVIGTVAGATYRALLGRRRTLLMGLLAGVPVLVGLLYRIGGEGLIDDRAVLDLLVVRTVLPLTALVFGTAALGLELEDGTGVALLTKPIPRWQIVVAKVLVAGAVTTVFSAVPAVATALLLGAPDAPATASAYAVGVAAGSFAYVTAFVAVSVITSRALVVGLAYTLIWEGWLAGLLPGTRSFSLREATLAVVDTVTPRFPARDGLELAGAVVLLGAVLVGGLLLATARLSRYEVRSGD